MSATVLHLTPWMKLGYGVAESVAALSRGMEPSGVHSVIGVLGEDHRYPDLDIRKVRPDPQEVEDLAGRVGATVAVAHGSPYFEVLAGLRGRLGTIAYEYGDPTPEMFDSDARERRRIAEYKRTDVYPNLDAVACISNFIRHDIRWPQAQVIVLGVEHIEDLGPKPLCPPAPADRPLRVGTLMRLGSGEARYKGNGLLANLREQIAVCAGPVSFEVMGRGNDEDAQQLREAGFRVHLNATDEERTTYLREIDVFVSPSQWEGCNLPLVEAQALGTPGLAFETGAHPEFTPLVFPSVRLMAEQIAAYDASRDLLLRSHGRAAYHFVRGRMSWELASHQMAALVRRVDPGEAPRPRPMSSRVRVTARRARATLQRHGVAKTAKHATLRVMSVRRGSQPKS